LRKQGIYAGFVLILMPFMAGCKPSQNALERVRQKGELVIITDPTYPPFEFNEGEKLIGFDVDLAREIGKELGVRVHFIVSDWDGVLPSLHIGKADIAMSGVTITEERKQMGYVYSRPYFLSGQTIARRKGDTRIRQLEDLKDKKAAVQGGTTGESALQRAGVPDDHILRFKTLPEALLSTRAEKSDSDGTVADVPALKYFLLKDFPDLELVGNVPVKENLAVVTWKDAPELRDAINKALGKIMADGRYARIYEHWIKEPATPEMMAELDRVRDAGISGASVERPSLASLLRKALPQLLSGAKLTLFLTFTALLFGIPVGLGISLLRISHFPPFRILAMVYVEVVRGTPLLIQIFIIYFVLPRLHLQFSSLASGVLALSLNSAAYIAEIFRAGIQSIDIGQMEAARALGMDYPTAMRWVILPQTLRRVLPPLTNEAVALLKDSSLVSVVALEELMRKGQILVTNTGEPTPIYLAVALLYLAMTLPLTFLVRRLEAAWQPITREKGRKRNV